MKNRLPLSALWLVIPSLISPLGGQSMSVLELEKSSNLNIWERVTITPEMISDSGKLQIPPVGPQQFYRMKTRLLELPLISIQPLATTGVEEGESVTFMVGSQGDGLSYQWYVGQSGDTSQPISGATTQSYNTGAVNADTFYWVQIINDAGSTNSETASVTINRPPTITTQPSSQTIVTGNTATLTVSAAGSAPFVYQWFQGNLNLPTNPVGENSFTFTSPVLTTTTNYWVKITNAFGEVNSNSVTVTVNSAAPSNMTLIPAGAFAMGDSLDSLSDAPTRTVTLDDFYVGNNEVTKGEWDEVRIWGLSNGYTDLAEGSGKAVNHPVQNITWYDVVKWCNARSEKDGLTPVYFVNDERTTLYKTGDASLTNAQVSWTANGYRLPTEAEWEKAARGGLSGKRFPWGDTISHSQANYYASSGYSYDLSGSLNNFHPTYATGSQIYTSPVGAFAANGYGLNDMTGNVMEWCWDWYDTYPVGAQTNPRGASSGSFRVYRGGGWDREAKDCRIASRSYNFQWFFEYNVGLRIVRSSIP